ncbi:MAG TPA: metallophosphoesterase [Candidatus Limnocylindrales bacterium]|nr:metallophosphoesterase [Candidatus Limnocylindrales bacterium]
MKLFAISDLHIGHPENRVLAEELWPETADDWLVVAGDVAEVAGDIIGLLRLLAGRFAKVIWAPGNHELWTPARDPLRLRGVPRYEYLVDRCRELGVVTPEDPYPVWPGDGGPVVIAALLVLYDYTFRPAGTTVESARAKAYESGIVCTDEMFLHPDPYPSRELWCAARVAYTERRLSEVDSTLPTILANHYPLVFDPVSVLRHPEFAIWCGTRQTATWHTRFRARTVVYGHLHIPRTTWYDGVKFQEVSLGYPREWRARGRAPGLLRQILPMT